MCLVCLGGPAQPPQNGRASKEILIHVTAPHELAICSSSVLPADAFLRDAAVSNLLQLSVFLRNPFVQVLPLEIGKLGRKQPAIPLNVSPMAPHLGRIEVNHSPSPLWMFLSGLVD
jgi:hypothetical protein